MAAAEGNTNDEFCITDDGFCIKRDKLCIKIMNLYINDKFCIKNELCKTMTIMYDKFCINNDVCIENDEVDGLCIENDGLFH